MRVSSYPIYDDKFWKVDCGSTWSLDRTVDKTCAFADASRRAKTFDKVVFPFPNKLNMASICPEMHQSLWWSLYSEELTSGGMAAPSIKDFCRQIGLSVWRGDSDFEPLLILDDTIFKIKQPFTLCSTLIVLSVINSDLGDSPRDIATSL